MCLSAVFFLGSRGRVGRLGVFVKVNVSESCGAGSPGLSQIKGL